MWLFCCLVLFVASSISNASDSQVLLVFDENGQLYQNGELYKPETVHRTTFVQNENPSPPQSNNVISNAITNYGGRLRNVNDKFVDFMSTFFRIKRNTKMHDIVKRETRERTVVDLLLNLILKIVQKAADDLKDVNMKENEKTLRRCKKETGEEAIDFDSNSEEVSRTHNMQATAGSAESRVENSKDSGFESLTEAKSVSLDAANEESTFLKIDEDDPIETEANNFGDDGVKTHILTRLIDLDDSESEETILNKKNEPSADTIDINVLTINNKG